MTSGTPMNLPPRTLSSTLAGPSGTPALTIDSIPVRQGEQLAVTFDSVGPRWRQGVFLATNGVLSTAGSSGRSLVLWSDSVPKRSLIDVDETDGALVIYNVWDSGRRLGPFESQSATSGMVVEELPGRSRRYSCNDIGSDPDFDRLVFTVRVVQS